MFGIITKQTVRHLNQKKVAAVERKQSTSLKYTETKLQLIYSELRHLQPRIIQKVRKEYRKLYEIEVRSISKVASAVTIAVVRHEKKPVRNIGSYRRLNNVTQIKKLELDFIMTNEIFSVKIEHITKIIRKKIDSDIFKACQKFIY